MNKFLPSAFAAALTLVATVGFSQPRSAYAGYTPMNFGQGSVNSTTSSNSTAAAISRSLVGQSQASTTTSSPSRTSDRRYAQAQYVATAVVVPQTQDMRGAVERMLRTGAPTKSAAMSRMRELINDIGVPVRVVSLDIVKQ